MGSYSISQNRAVDSKVAATDQALSLSLANSSNARNTLDGSIVDSRGEGNTLNLLDGGAIDKAFNFAGYSLSAVLDSIVTGQKTQAAAAQYTADTIGDAVKQTALANEESEKTNAAIPKNLIIVGALGIGYLMVRRRGKR